MTVKLSSYRVAATMDPSAYVDGMARKVMADQAGAASSRQVAEEIKRTDTKVSQAGDSATRLSRQYVDGFATAERFSKAISTLGRGIETGNVRMSQADVILEGIYRKYNLTANAAELAEQGHYQLANSVTALNARLSAERAALEAEKVQLDASTLALKQNGAARNQAQYGSGIHNFNTANVAAQFQDIGVTAAMGMNPMQIALQQGTQLSGVLGGQGLTGVVKTLGAAFTSIVSPVSILTIGVVALTAVGIQAFMGMVAGADKSTSAIERSKDSLDAVLRGYGDIKRAADAAAESAGRLPTGAASAGAGMSYTTAQIAFVDNLAKAIAAQDELNRKMEAWSQLRADSKNRFPDDTQTLARFDALDKFGEALTKTKLGVQATSSEINEFVSTAYRLKAVASDPATRQLADDMITVGDGMLYAKAQAEAAQAAVVALQRTSPLYIAVSVGLIGVDDALTKLKALAPDMRTARQIALDELNAGLNAASATGLAGAGLRKQLQDQYAVTVAALDLKDAQDEANKAAAEGARHGDQLRRAYADLLSTSQERVGQAQLEAQVLGMSEAAAARLRIEQDLLNQATQAGIILDTKKRAELIATADRIADAETRTKSLTKAREDEAAQLKATTDALVAAAQALFQPWKNLDDVVGSVMGSFAQVGQTNLKSSLANLINPPTPSSANDNGPTWTAARARVFGEAIGEGFGGFLKDNRENIGAALGGLGIGYQTQSPLMGAVGGALAGSSAGPLGAVIGGLAGLVGGLFGMNEALEKAKKELADNRISIDQFIAAGLGDELDKDAAAVAQFRAQGAKLVELAQAAGDTTLVARLNAAMNAYKGTLAAARVRDDYTKAKNDLIEAYRAEADAQQSVIDRTRDYITALSGFKQGLMFDKTYSPLNPQGMLQQAQTQFDLILGKARLGDAGAQGQVQGASSQYLEAARGYLGSSQGYQDIFNRVQAGLGSAITAGTSQISNAERQLDVANKSLAVFGEVRDGVKSVADAMAIMTAVLAAAGKLNTEQGAKLAEEIAGLTKKVSVLAKKAA